MWVYTAVVRMGMLYSLLAIGLASYGEVNTFPNTEETWTLAKRTSRVKRKRGILPQWKQTFKKTKVNKNKTILKYAKPPSQAELYFEEGTDEAQLEKITLMEIQQLYQLLKTSNRPDIRLRLASLYVEQSRIIEARLYEVHNREMEKYKNKKRNTLPKINLSSVRDYSRKAINLFESYLKQYPKSKRLDEVLFQLGYSYFQVGKSQLGKTYYERLVRRFPKSEYMEDAFFHLGEYSFDRNQWQVAREYYDKASRFRSKFYSFSIYKIAWCLYNEGKIDSAMNLMKRIIQENRSKKYAHRIDFSQDALNDLASFYLYSKRPASQVYSYLKSLSSDPKTLHKLLRKVANGYKDMGEMASMRVVFNRLIQMDPYHPRSYEYKYQIIQAYSHTREIQIFNKEFVDWIQNYSKGSVWSRKNSSDPTLLKKADNLMELTLRNYTFRMHHLFLKTKGHYEKKQSLFGYQFYMKFFTHSSFYPDVLFHYGEILFDTDQLEKAVKQYDQLVQKYPKNKNYAVAMLNRVLALEKMIPSEASIKKSVKGQSAEKISVPMSVKKFTTAVMDYHKAFPKRKNVSNMIYTLAKIYSEYKQHSSAIQYWMMIINQYPDKNNPVFSQSIHSVLDAYNLLKDFENLGNHAKRFLTMPAVQTLPIIQDIRTIVRQIEFKQAQDLAQSGNLKNSAELYEKFYRNNPKNKLATIALYNAAINYKKTNRLSKAIQLYSILSKLPGLDKKPKMHLAVLQDLPNLYQKQGRYYRAATAFKQYAIRYPKNADTGKYWYNSALIFDGMNVYQEAVSSYMKYFALTRSAERYQVYFLIARMRERQNQKSKAIGNYLKYVNRPDPNRLTQVMAIFKIAKLNQDLGNHTTALDWYKKTVRAYQKLNAGVRFAATAQFQLTYQVYKKFKSVRIPNNPTKQAQAIKQKLALLEKLKTETKNIIRFNYGPQIVAALTLMGLSNQHLGNSILKAAIPKGLNKAERVQYQQGLQQTANPFIESAKQYLEKAISKSKTVDGYISWLKEARKALQPSQYQESTYRIRFMGMP